MSPSSTIFVFDLHDVLVKKNYRGMFWKIMKKCYRLDLLFLLFNPFFILKITHLLKKSRIPEHYIIELAHDYPRLKGFVSVIIALMNEQYMIEPVMSLVQNLKQQGYSVYIFSNIGERTLSHFTQQYPFFMHSFDGILFVQESDNWIQKPDDAAYQKFLDWFNLNPQQCLFIDNSKINILAAERHGFRTILYKSPEQLDNAIQILQEFAHYH